MIVDNFSIQNNVKYDLHGVTMQSNNPVVVPRNKTGHVIIQSTSSLLVIEGIDINYTTRSVLNVLDTRFNYFSFPVTVTANTSSIDLNIDLDLNALLNTTASSDTTNTSTAVVGNYPPFGIQGSPGEERTNGITGQLFRWNDTTQQWDPA